MGEGWPTGTTRLGAIQVAVLLAVTAAAVAAHVALHGAAGVDAGTGWTFWAGIALQSVASFAFLLQRRAPVAVGVVVAGVAVLLVARTLLPHGTDDRAVDVWVPFALCLVAAGLALYAEGRRWRPVAGLMAAATVLAVRPWDPSWSVTPFGLLYTAVPALIGGYLAVRLRLVQTLRDRADRAERERHLLAERARAEERSRLAVEMHDVVTHHVVLMVLRAGALRVTATDPATRDVAEELREDGRRALEEMRDLIRVLRAPGEELATTAGATEEDLRRLVEETRGAGMRIDLVVDDADADLSPTVGRTLYRVVQEALSNAGKHATGAPVTVRLDGTPTRIRLRVHNPPAGPALKPTRLSATGSGTGLAGLRNRVGLVGGILDTGPDPDGGFLVEADLPRHVASQEAP